MRFQHAMMFAVDQDGGFGLRGALPWPRNAQDLRFFKTTTLGHTVCAGTNTFKTLPHLPERRVIQITRNPQLPHQYTIDEVFEAAHIGKVFWIGGAEVLRAVAKRPEIECAFINIIHGSFEADVKIDLQEFLRGGDWELREQTEREGVTFTEWRR